MFQLSENAVHLNAQAADKREAIMQVASALASAGYVDEAYLDGMFEREAQAVTYLGQGIAIPHGTTSTRHLVKKTGVHVFHFPDGVVWGEEGERAYVVIGIAACSDEHLTLLRQLAQCLSDDHLEQKLRRVVTADSLIALLTGQPIAGTPMGFLLNTPAESLSTLQAIQASFLRQKNAVAPAFVGDVLSRSPIYLGQGIWLSESKIGNASDAVVLSRVSLMEEDKPVHVLVTASRSTSALDPFLTTLAEWIYQKQVEKLTQLSGSDLSDAMSLQFDEVGVVNPALVTTKSAKLSPETSPTAGNTRIMVVRNPHGLHTRPGTHLVNVIKMFKSKVTVSNLDGSAKPVSATSLIKIVSLGAKKGHRLAFEAVGDDAELVLNAIEKAMSDGLGEEL